MAKTFFIDYFQQARPDCFVHFNRRANNLFGQIFMSEVSLLRQLLPRIMHPISKSILSPRLRFSAVSPCLRGRF